MGCSRVLYIRESDERDIRMDSALKVLLFAINAILPIMGTIVLGYYLKKIGIFTPEFLKTGNRLVFRVLIPVLLFSNIIGMGSFRDIRWDAAIYVVILVLIIFVIGLFMAASEKDKKKKGVVLQCVFRSNFALIGVPLAELMAGSKGIQVAAILSAFTIPLYNVLAVIALSLYVNGDGEQISGKALVKKFLKEIAANPLIRGVVLGLVVVLIKTLAGMVGVDYSPVSDKLTFVGEIIDYLARTASPLSLLILGGLFNFEKIKGYKVQIYKGVIGRIIISPLLGIGLAAVLTKAGVLNFQPEVFATLVSVFATPVAVSSAIMAEEMNNDGQLAGQLVVWTTLISSVSIFITLLALKSVGLL